MSDGYREPQTSGRTVQPGRLHGIVCAPTIMDATATAIAALLLENWPNPYCYPCLAKKLQVTEREASKGAQTLILLPGFHMRRLRCGRCGRVDDMLQKVLSA